MVRDDPTESADSSNMRVREAYTKYNLQSGQMFNQRKMKKKAVPVAATASAGGGAAGRSSNESCRSGKMQMQGFLD